MWFIPRESVIQFMPQKNSYKRTTSKANLPDWNYQLQHIVIYNMQKCIIYKTVFNTLNEVNNENKNLINERLQK